AGHVFGFADESSDPTSANYYSYAGQRIGLSQSDVALLQSVYGPRSADHYEGAAGNNTFATATPIDVPQISADISSLGDADYYRFTVPPHPCSAVTVTVQTTGLSLLTPRLTIYNALHQVIATSSAADPLSGDVSITL